MKNPILDNCELCGAPLDADNFYGSDEFPLCKFHYVKTSELLAFLLSGGKPQKQEQLSLFCNEVAA